MSHLDYRAPKKKEKKNSGLLPVMGLGLAISLGVMSFFLAPELVELGRNQSSKLATQFDSFEDQFGKSTVDYIAAGLLWLILLGFSMFFVSLFIGEDPDKESLRTMGPSPADKKAVVKQLKKDLRDAKKRAQEKKRRQK